MPDDQTLPKYKFVVNSEAAQSVECQSLAESFIPLVPNAESCQMTTQ